jgi:hypothetical protein
MKKCIAKVFSLLSLLSMTPLINIHSSEKIGNGPNGVLRGLGDADS